MSTQKSIIVIKLHVNTYILEHINGKLCVISYQTISNIDNIAMTLMLHRFLVIAVW